MEAKIQHDSGHASISHLFSLGALIALIIGWKRALVLGPLLLILYFGAFRAHDHKIKADLDSQPPSSEGDASHQIEAPSHLGDVATPYPAAERASRNYDEVAKLRARHDATTRKLNELHDQTALIEQQFNAINHEMATVPQDNSKERRAQVIKMIVTCRNCLVTWQGSAASIYEEADQYNAIVSREIKPDMRIDTKRRASIIAFSNRYLELLKEKELRLSR